MFFLSWCPEKISTQWNRRRNNSHLKYQSKEGLDQIKNKKFKSTIILKPALINGAHLMVRRSQPRMAVSFAVASWLQLWWGLHLPEVNFNWPLPSRVAVLETCRGHHLHYHLWAEIWISSKYLWQVKPVQKSFSLQATLNRLQLFCMTM